MTNRTTWAEAHGMTIERAAELPIHELYLLSGDLDEMDKAVKVRRAFLAAVLVAKYEINPNTMGTVRNEDGEYDVVVTTPKNVSWDQDKLQAASDGLVSMGEDPREYIETKASVSEGKYNSWPSSLRALFEPARTVKPGKPKIVIEAKALEAA